MQNITNCVLNGTVLRESVMTTFMCYDPTTSSDGSGDSSIRKPNGKIR
jgi:hypothetical protein